MIPSKTPMKAWLVDLFISWTRVGRLSYSGDGISITIITTYYILLLFLIYLFIFLRVFSLYPNDIIDISFTLLQASFNTFQDYVPPLPCDFEHFSMCYWSAFDEREVFHLVRVELRLT